MNIAHIALGACILFSMAGTAAAQDRMPPIPASKMTDAQKQAAAELTSGPRKVLSGPFIPLLRSPEFLNRLQKMGEYLRFENSLGHRITEFIILYTARQWTQEFEWDSHYELAQKAGVEPDTIAALSEGRRPDRMTEDEEIAYDFCDELHKNKSVSDATYARAVKKFGEQGAVDMTGVTGYYSMLGMILNMARTPLPPGRKPGLASFPH